MCERGLMLIEGLQGHLASRKREGLGCGRVDLWNRHGQG